jgi:hypothetical protein
MSGRLRKLGRSRVVKLPDGRKRVIDRFEVFGSAGDPATVDSEVFIAYGTAHPKYTACLLVDQPDLSFSPDQGVEQDLVRVYEEMPAASATPNEVRAGGDQIAKDADGRKLLTRNSIMLAAGTLTEGALGSTVTVDGVIYALDSVAHASNGAVRTITRRYSQTNATAGTADEIGPIVVSYPFNQVGDATHAVASQVYEQPAANYAPLTLNATRSVTVGGSAQTLYYTGDLVPPGRQGASLVRFTRQWANKPGSRSEFGTIAASFPGLRRTQAELDALIASYLANLSTFIPNTASQLRTGFSQVVPCRIDYDYYRIAASGGDYTSAGSIPLVPIQDYVAEEAWGGRQGPLSIFLSDVDTLNRTSTAFRWINLLTTPTRTAYQALGSFGLVVDCRVRRYMGPFYERRTVRVTPL